MQSCPCQDSNPYTLQKAKDDHGIRTWEGEHLQVQIPPTSPATCSFVIEAARLALKRIANRPRPGMAGGRVELSGNLVKAGDCKHHGPRGLGFCVCSAKITML